MHIVNVLISDSWGDVSPEAFNRGIGGREGAMIFLSQQWAKKGHKVTNFVNVEKSSRIEETRIGVGARNKATGQILDPPEWDIGYHEYIPIGLTKTVLSNFPHDVVIAWECPSVFNNTDIEAKLKITEMQVCHLSGDESEAAAKHCDFVAALSPWHKEFMLQSFLDMPSNKVVVFPNGVDISRYPKDIVDIKTNEHDEYPKIIYSSSPDRGLWQLLQSWPYLKQKFPKAQLNVAYGAKKWTEQLKWAHTRQGEMAVEIEEMMSYDGVKDLGKIGQDKLVLNQLEANLWAYPLDSIQATESGCITAVENAAAGNPIVTTDCDCMESEFGPVGVIAELPFDPEGFADCVEYVLSDPKIMKTLREDGREFAEGRDWSIIASQWLNFMENNI